MQLFSDFRKDIPTVKPSPGSYEWWYFDGISYDGKYSFVVIFYEGNPFSSKYIRSLSNKNSRSRALADIYPAISISVYENNEPVFCSLSEYPSNQCFFSRDRLDILIGANRLSAINEDEDLTYLLSLVEELPSGDRLNAELSFKSEDVRKNLLGPINQSEASAEHMWNLVQPKASLNGRMYIYEKTRLSHRIKMAGVGYHDHNLGTQPLREEFDDWYWGRFHFEKGTLIYYIMNKHSGRQSKAWYINTFNDGCITEFDEAALSESQLNRFLLPSKRKIEFKNEEVQVYIQQNKPVDSGPFYMRFSSEAVMHSVKDHMIAKSSGITEYIKPSRIHSRLYWPLVNMRRRQVGQKPHWVQKSPKLYRWTW